MELGKYRIVSIVLPGKILLVRIFRTISCEIKI